MVLLVAKNLDSAQWAEEYWNFAWRAYLTFYASLHSHYIHITFTYWRSVQSFFRTPFLFQEFPWVWLRDNCQCSQCYETISRCNRLKPPSIFLPSTPICPFICPLSRKPNIWYAIGLGVGSTTSLSGRLEWGRTRSRSPKMPLRWVGGEGSQVPQPTLRSQLENLTRGTYWGFWSAQDS